jgi:hypothetical protein
MWWKNEVPTEAQATKAVIKGREYPITFRAVHGIHSYTLTGPRGATYKAMPAKPEGIYQVMSFPSSRFIGYARVVDGVLVDAPEYC